jgi:hypothetical protein
MNKKDYCNYNTCLALMQMGYNEPSKYTWVHNCRVSDEILAKHPGLSDSGYMDLIDEYGGPYKREELYHTYIEPISRYSINSMIDTDLGEICSCVHLYDAQEWLRKREVYVSVMPEYNEFGPVKGVKYRLEVAHWKDDEFGYETIERVDPDDHHCVVCYDDYREALSEGIEDAVKYVKPL